MVVKIGTKILHKINICRYLKYWRQLKGLREKVVFNNTDEYFTMKYFSNILLHSYESSKAFYYLIVKHKQWFFTSLQKTIFKYSFASYYFTFLPNGFPTLPTQWTLIIGHKSEGYVESWETYKNSTEKQVVRYEKHSLKINRGWVDKKNNFCNCWF